MPGPVSLRVSVPPMLPVPMIAILMFDTCLAAGNLSVAGIAADGNGS
jgi:hypothetical protein